MGNETPPGPARDAFLGKLIDRTRARDPSRLVTLALIGDPGTYFRQVVPALLARIALDPSAPDTSRTAARVGLAKLALMPTLRFDPASERPFIISEFGADAFPGATGGEGAVETDDYQAMVYRRQFAMLANSRHLAGLSPWVLKDFRSPKRTRDFYNRKGLIDENGRRKKAFDVLRAYYTTR